MNGIMSLVTVFIAISIMLGIGVMILGETSGSIDCRTLEGNIASGTAITAGTQWANINTGAVGSTAVTEADNTGQYALQGSWAATCSDIQQQSQDGFNLHAYASIMSAIMLLAAGVMAMQGIRNHPYRCGRGRHSDHSQNVVAAAPRTQ